MDIFTPIISVGLAFLGLFFWFLTRKNESQLLAWAFSILGIITPILCNWQFQSLPPEFWMPFKVVAAFGAVWFFVKSIFNNFINENDPTLHGSYFIAAVLAGLVYSTASEALKAFSFEIPSIFWGGLKIGFLYVFLKGIQARKFSLIWTGVVMSVVSFGIFSLMFELDKMLMGTNEHIYLSWYISPIYHVVVPSILTLAIIYILKSSPVDEREIG